MVCRDDCGNADVAGGRLQAGDRNVGAGVSDDVEPCLNPGQRTGDDVVTDLLDR